MTREQVIQRLRYRTEAQLSDDAASGAYCLDRIVEIATAAVMVERERCAKVCRDKADRIVLRAGRDPATEERKQHAAAMVEDCEAAIRSGS